jgi:hypothetical protein
MIELEQFCEPDPASPMHEPFTQDEFTYATDSVVLVRVPKVRGAPVNSEVKVYELAKNFARAASAEFRLLAVAETRYHKGMPELRIGTAWFSKAYIDLIMELPGLTVSHAGEVEPMPFKFKGGMGFLAPLKVQARVAA